MATHGLLAGGARACSRSACGGACPFRPVFDALAIPAALIMGFGRIGNFIDGQIVGSLTTVPWAVQFPEADGFRHPVVLYDGLKNFLIIPILLWARRRGAPPGRLAALFVLLYAGLRIPIDLLREYPVNALGLPTGQGFNVIMAVVGAVLLAVNWWRWRGASAAGAPRPRLAAEPEASPGWRRPALRRGPAVRAASFPATPRATFPSRYGHRHPGPRPTRRCTLESADDVHVRAVRRRPGRLSRQPRTATRSISRPNCSTCSSTSSIGPGASSPRKNCSTASGPAPTSPTTRWRRPSPTCARRSATTPASPTFIRTIARRGYRFIARRATRRPRRRPATAAPMRRRPAGPRRRPGDRTTLAVMDFVEPDRTIRRSPGSAPASRKR